MLQKVHIPAPRHSESEEFSQDARDFFADRRAGHLSKWLYSTSEFPGDKADGAGAWAHNIEEAKSGGPYYVFLKEREIIRSALPVIADVINKPSRIIDLGPGSADAVEDKVSPIIFNASNWVKEYIAVDICPITSANAVAQMSRNFPFVKTRKIDHDFIQDAFYYGDDTEQEVAALFGLTLCNMPVDPRVKTLPELQLMSHLRRLKSHHRAPGAYLMITQDTNQDIDILRKAYLALTQHYTSVLYRIQRDLRISGDYAPEDFVMGVDYFEETQACALYFETTRRMSFILEDEFFQIGKGEKFYFHNAFKFSKETFLKSAEKMGYQLVHTQEDNDNPCLLHILKSAA